MDWLSEWLKSIILIILLATFIDLLLPNHSMQRYVKTVISLFILMTLLTPVFELFHKQWDISELLALADERQLGSFEQNTTVASARLSSLNSIIEQADKMKAANEDHALRLVESHVSGLIKHQVEELSKFPVDQVVVKAVIDEQGTVAIGHIRVTLLHTMDVQAPKDKGPIRPVHIAIQDINLSDRMPPPRSESSNSTSSELKQLQEKLKQSLYREWQVTEQKIDIVFS